MRRRLACLCLMVFSVAAGAQSPSGKCRIGGKVSPAGAELQCDLPEPLHLRNKGGSDGAGLCVFTSIAHTSRYQNVPLLEDFRDYMTKFPGGGYPEKVDAFVKRIAKERGQPVPEYFHYIGRDLSVLRKATESNRMVCVTYRYSPCGRYGGRTIAHMTNLVHLDKEWACVLDNNYPGVGNLEWMPAETFLNVFAGKGTGWAVIFTLPGPPPLPWN